VCHNVNPHADTFLPRIIVDPQVENPHRALSPLFGFQLFSGVSRNSQFFVNPNPRTFFLFSHLTCTLFTGLCIDNEPRKGKTTTLLTVVTDEPKTFYLYRCSPTPFPVCEEYLPIIIIIRSQIAGGSLSLSRHWLIFLSREYRGAQYRGYSEEVL